MNYTRKQTLTPSVKSTREFSQKKIPDYFLNKVVLFLKFRETGISSFSRRIAMATLKRLYKWDDKLEVLEAGQRGIGSRPCFGSFWEENNSFPF